VFTTLVVYIFVVMEINRERTGVEKKFYEVTKNILAELSYELYDLDYITGSKTLRIFIMDPATGSALIEDCVKVDRAFSPFMEENDWIPDEIVLEVSSPGVYRHLTTLEHFQWAKGQQIQLQLSKSLSQLLPDEELDKKTAKAKKFLCVLEQVADDHIVVNLDEDFSLKVNFEDIKKANLEPEMSK
jgi:ribosome maturation factor RimP